MVSISPPYNTWIHFLVLVPTPYCSPGLLVLQLTILTLSAWTVLELSNLKLTSLIKKVQTSSQKRYVSR